jgi:hypothetical protein
MVGARIRMRVHLEASGMDTEVAQSHPWTLRGGRAIRFAWFTDVDRAFRELARTFTGTR